MWGDLVRDWGEAIEQRPCHKWLMGVCVSVYEGENTYAFSDACSCSYVCARGCLHRVCGPINWEEGRQEIRGVVRRFAENQSAYSLPWFHPREKH